MVSKSRVFAALSFFLTCILSPSVSFAQTEADFVAAFSGDWLVFDPAYGDQAPCVVMLSPQKQEGDYSAETKQCRAPLTTIARWKIADNQLLFVSADGDLVARLGGNQNRISGETFEDAGIVLERPDTIKSDIQSDCAYRGYSTDCGTVEEKRKPIDTSTLSEQVDVRILVKLNVRREPRPDAEILSQLMPQACVPVSQCLTASDGNWCKTNVGSDQGWIVQEAIRQEKWRTLTYVSGC